MSPDDLRTPRGAVTARDDGQATVELVALLPLMLVAALAGGALLAAHVAGEQAGQAAQAGAMALLEGGDPRAAARRTLGPHTHAAIHIHGRRVTVRVRPNLPIKTLEHSLTTTATADAGPPEASP